MAATLARRARIKVSGAAVAFADEACTNAGDDQTYQITAAPKRVWDREAPVTVEVDGFVTLEDYTVNRLTGTITFAAADALRGVVTVTGQYLPLSTAAECRSFTFSAIGSNGDASTLEDDDIVRDQMHRDCSGNLGRWYIDSLFRDVLTDEATLLLELAVASGAAPIVRAWVMCPKIDTSGAHNGFLEESVDFEGSADADGRSFTLNP